MGARYVLVSFTWRETPKVKELEPLFGTALDWLRYSSDCWLLWTTESPAIWFQYIKPFLGEKDSVFITEISFTPGTYSGWQPQWIIDWMYKTR
jgi:hypothetical protein